MASLLPANAASNTLLLPHGLPKASAKNSQPNDLATPFILAELEVQKDLVTAFLKKLYGVKSEKIGSPSDLLTI